MRLSSFRIAIFVFLSATFLIIAQAQKSKELAKGQYSLTVKSTPVISIALHAKEAKLSEISEELSKRLNAQIVLSGSMENQVVTVDLKGAALEPAMQTLAPQVFIDYKLTSGKQAPVVIYLSANNEPQPAFDAAVQTSSQAILFEGDTEEGVEPKSEEVRKRLESLPLRVNYADKKLSVQAKSQSLILVVLKIGEALNIPVELKIETPDLITTEILDAPVEEAVTRISPQVALYVRADLQKAERSLVRMVLEAPKTAAQENSAKQ